MSVHIYPCNYGMPGGVKRGLHHYEANRAGVVACRHCGDAPSTPPGRLVPAVAEAESDADRLRLIGFVIVRLDEEEAMARATDLDNERYGWQVDVSYPQEDPGSALVNLAAGNVVRLPYGIGWDSAAIRRRGSAGIVVYDEGSLGRNEAEHIARHDPERALREVQAKRLLVSAAEKAIGFGGAEEAWADLVLRALAAPYCDHPEFNDDWRLPA